MRKAAALFLAFFLLAASLCSCGGQQNQNHLDVEGVRIELGRTSAQEMVDAGFTIVSARVPSHLYTVRSWNHMILILEKGETRIRADSRVYYSGLSQEYDAMLADAQTIGIIDEVCIYFDEGRINNGSYNDVPFSEVTLDTIGLWQCDERAVIVGGEIIYQSEVNKDNIYVRFSVEENEADGSIERILYVCIMYSLQIGD